MHPLTATQEKSRTASFIAETFFSLFIPLFHEGQALTAPPPPTAESTSHVLCPLFPHFPQLPPIFPDYKILVW